MRTRRLAGVLAGLVMSQLVLAGGDLICLQHGGENGPATSASAFETAGAAHHHDGDDRQQHHGGSTDLPAVPNCCQAMTTCSASVALRSGDLAFGPDVLHGPTVRPVSTLPRSRVETPDPPPPRA